MSGSQFTPDLIQFPQEPGVYLMKDGQGKIIYVGKANNIKKRLSSYFRENSGQSLKNRHMVSQVRDIECLCTNTEKEALLLEYSLIKKYKPKYNIILRDDKSYILFKLDKGHDYSRLTLTRKLKKDGSVYFGPYTSALAARNTLKLINRLFPLRKCSDNIFKNRTRPCLQYHIGRCLAPCVKEVPKQKYAEVVHKVELFLKGKSGELISKLKSEMHLASQELKFEKAAELRDQIKAIEKTVEQQSVIFPSGGDLDVLNLTASDKGLALGMLFVRHGNLIDAKNFFWQNKYQEALSSLKSEGSVSVDLPQEEKAHILEKFIMQFYSTDRMIPDKIVLPVSLENELTAQILSERKGTRVNLKTAWLKQEKALLDLAVKNALQGMAREGEKEPLERLSRKLGLQNRLERIEALDASHFYGQGMLVGQVVYQNNEFKKNSYRVYKFPELEGSADDFAAFRHWLHRRLNSGPPWPDLVLVDGGRGQLSALSQEIQDMGQECPAREWIFLGIVKNKRRQGELGDRIFRQGRQNPLQFRPGSPELLFLQDLRDNAHRFVLSRQKVQRNETRLQSKLDNLPGVGPKLARELWDRFGSVENIAQASKSELLSVPGIGIKKLEQIVQVLQSKDWGIENFSKHC